MTTRPQDQRPARAFALSAVCACLTCAFGDAGASSHREAPFMSTQPSVDGTDLYMFRSYEAGRQGYVTVMADYIPFQDPQGGPNFYQFNQNALYQIHFDNNGDAKEDISFQFTFKNTSKGQTLPSGGNNTEIPLINSGTISSVNAPTINVRETFNVSVVRGDSTTGTPAALTRISTGATTFDKPIDNIGDKTFGGSTGYATYAALHIYDVAIPGCGAGRVFVGQRKEPFYIAVGKIFDLFNLNPLGPEVNGNKNDLEAKNISTIAMEIPISCLATASDPVIGAWTTSSLRQGQTLNPTPGHGINNAVVAGGAWVQVSRVGMPLVNEVIIGLDDKDRFNASKPSTDSYFASYVTNPAFPALVQKLFPSVTAPKNFPRTDLVAVFLTGISGLNQPKNVAPSEMLRLNTSIAPNYGAQDPLGVAGGDKAGFPNGRRPGDDIVDASLRVAMGALCVLTGSSDTLKVGCSPSDAPSGGLPFTDGVRKTYTDFQRVFPYFDTPLPGNFNN